MPSNNALITSTLHDLIAAPVLAVVEADYMAAREFVRYIDEYGFNKASRAGAATGSNSGRESDGFIGDLRMVSFRVDQTEPDGRVRSRLVRLPALSLIPLPLLKVKDADFSFAVRILEGVPKSPPGPLRLLGDQEDDDPHGPAPPTWRAILVPDDSGDEGSPGWSDGLDANMEVKLSVTQSDLPAGIVRLLSVMNESTQIVCGYLRLSTSRVDLSPGGSATLKLEVFDFRSEPVQGAALRCDYPPDAGIALTGNGKPWPSGGELEADSSGCVEIVVSTAGGAPSKAQVQIAVRFAATVDGVPLSEALIVRIGG